MSAETLVNLEQWTPLTPESQSYTTNSSRENVTTRITLKSVQSLSHSGISFHILTLLKADGWKTKKFPKLF